MLKLARPGSNQRRILFRQGQRKGKVSEADKLGLRFRAHAHIHTLTCTYTNQIKKHPQNSGILSRICEIPVNPNPKILRRMPRVLLLQHLPSFIALSSLTHTHTHTYVQTL